MATINWQANGSDGSEVSDVIDFGLVDAKGRAIGTCLFVQPNLRRRYADGTWTCTALGTFSYSIQSTRNGGLFGGIPKDEGDFATIGEAKAAAEKAVERSRKAQARKHGATVEEAKAKKAEQSAKRAAKTAAWLADYEARKAQREAASAAPVEAAPVAVEAPDVEAAPVEAAEVAIEVEVDPEVARFRGFRGPDGELRFRKVEPAPVELPRCRNCGVAFDPAVEGVADVFVACGSCRHGQLEPGEEPDCACHRDPTLFA